MSRNCFLGFINDQREQMFTNSNGGSERLCSPFKMISIDAADAWSCRTMDQLDIKINLNWLDKYHLILLKTFPQRPLQGRIL